MQALMKVLLRSSLLASSVLFLDAVAITGSPRMVTSAAVAPSLSWQGPQFLQAGADGRVRLLRGDTLDVYSLRSGLAASPRRLERSGLVEGGTTAAAMSLNGNSWVVNSANHILSFRAGKVEALPEVGWLVTSVGFLGDVMVAGVLPMSVGGLQHATRPAAPPMILGYEGGRWSPRVNGVFPQRSRSHDPIGAVFAEHTIRLAGGGTTALWVAYPYLGRAVRFTAGGKPDLEIVLGSGAASYREDENKLRLDFQDKLKKQGYDIANAKTGVFSAKLRIRGMTVAADDVLYFVVAASVAGGDTLLARFDPAHRTVRSTPVDVAPDGELSLAAGSDGLYLAAAQGNEGRWRIEWESLNQAVWRDLPNTTVENR